MKDYKKKIVNKLLAYGKEIELQYAGNSKTELGFTPDKKADDFVLHNPLAFLFGVILDQGMKAEKVWTIPYELKRRLGHFNIKKIAEMSDPEIKKVFREKPTLHRFPNTMALCIKSACQLLIDKNDGKAENLWSDKPKSEDLQKRFEQFKGIGQKKASMATNMLLRDFGISLADEKGIDISYDVHIRRIFIRSGLVDRDNRDLIVQTARKLNPEYPAALDEPCWEIGRTCCYPSNPACSKCPIKKVCPKIMKGAMK